MNQKNVYFDYVMKHVSRLDEVKDFTLIKGYHQIFELYPGLHPDGFDEEESGWTDDLKPVCAEMWRRLELDNSKINIEHMYYINKAFRKLVAGSASQTKTGFCNV